MKICFVNGRAYFEGHAFPFFGSGKDPFWQEGRKAGQARQEIDWWRSFLPAIPDVPAFPAFFSAVRQREVTPRCRQGVIKVEARLFLSHVLFFSIH